MRVKAGYIVKIADIGPLATVKRTDKGKALVEFFFQEGKAEMTIPVSIITSIVSKGETSVPA